MMTTTELLTGLLATLCQAGHFDCALNIKNPWPEQGYHGRCCVSLKEKLNESSLPLGASLLLSLLLQTQKWELHDGVHPLQFIPPHWRTSPHGCDSKTSWIPGFKSKMIDSFLSGSFKTLKTKWFVLACEWEYESLLQHYSSIDLQVLCKGGQH